MPKIKMTRKPKDALQEMCSKHPTSLLEYFCRRHEQLCCILCVNADHDSCQNVSHVSDVSDGIAMSSAYTQLMADLNALASDVTEQKGRVDLSREANEKYHSEALAGMRDFRREVEKLLDLYEEKTLMKLSELNHGNCEKIKAASTECQAIFSEVTAIITDLGAKAKAGKSNQLFVGLEIAKERLRDIKTRATESSECKLVKYEFQPDEKIEDIMLSLSVMWSLSIDEIGDEETKVLHSRKIKVKTADDTNDCTITGIVALPGDRIALADFDNAAVKMVDVNQNTVIYRLSLTAKPQDIVAAGPNKLAVSLGAACAIGLLTVTDVLSQTGRIDLEEAAYGLCYFKDTFIVMFCYKGLIQLIDTSGIVLKTLSTDFKGSTLFMKPRFAALGRGHDVIYVTDQEANTVTTMTVGGHVISVYKNEQLKTPQGVTVGADGKVYVASAETHTVHQLSPRGEHLQIILDQRRGLPNFPRALAYGDMSKQLYVASASSVGGKREYVNIFQLE